MTDAPLAADSPEAAGQPRRRTGAAVIALSVLAGLLAATSITLALVARSQHHRTDFARARQAAASAAGQLIVNLDALSAPTVDRDLKLVVDASTGTFHRQFSSSLSQLKAYVTSQQISSQGNVRSVAVVRSDSDTATVLVAVDRTFKDRTHQDGVVANDRWKLSMEKHGGRWLVAELEPVA